MGFEFPAIGAKIANPDKEVVLFVGDGGPNDQPGIGYFEHLQGANQGGCMLNNHSLGNGSSMAGIPFYEGRTSESVFDTLPDFQLMAQAYGIKNYKFDNPETMSSKTLK